MAKRVAGRPLETIFPRLFGGGYSIVDALSVAAQEKQLIVLLVACLVGLIPESGPHLIFLTLYAEGTIPLSIFLASSIVQDGHGMLPMLAESQQNLGMQFGIRSIPTMIIFVGGIEKSRQSGAMDSTTIIN